jgi:tetratricopeptide (TPR) repeat protein
MKKLALLFVSMYIGTVLFYGQTGQTPEGLLKQKAKSDEDIQNIKKNIKSSTWEKRGDLFLDMAQFNTKILYQGMLKNGITGAEMIVGKPKSIKDNNGNEDWIYERVTLHFVGNALESWDETMPIDSTALDQAFYAYHKADTLDEKGKFKTKNNVKINVSMLRELYSKKGLKMYYAKNYAEAVKSFDKVLILGAWPKVESDSFKVGLVTYYAGLIALEGKDYKAAEKYYTKCIENNWEAGAPYSGLASVYKETKDSKKELEILEKGYNKYPGSKELMIGFINYYLFSGQSEKALEKLELAIKDDPSNFTFVFAKATLYENMSKDSTDKYTKEQKAELLGKAVEEYKKAIVIKPDYFDANFNLGALFYNEAVNKIKIADGYDPRKQQKEFDLKMTEADEDLKKALPYIEKAYQINPNEGSVIQTLATIFRRLKQYDKAKEMQAKYESLPKESGGIK